MHKQFLIDQHPQFTYHFQLHITELYHFSKHQNSTTFLCFPGISEGWWSCRMPTWFPQCDSTSQSLLGRTLLELAIFEERRRTLVNS